MNNDNTFIKFIGISVIIADVTILVALFYLILNGY